MAVREEIFDQIQGGEQERSAILGIAAKLSQGHHGGVGLDLWRTKGVMELLEYSVSTY